MKKYIMVVVVILTMLISSIGVFAVVEPTNNSVAYQVAMNHDYDNTYSYYNICMDSSGNILIQESDMPLVLSSYGTDGKKMYAKLNATIKYTRYTPTGEYLSSVTEKMTSDSYSGTKSVHPNQNIIYYSNYDIHTAFDLFFYTTLPPLPLAPYQLEIQPQPLTQSVTQNLEILLPFGLGILSLMVLLAYLPRFLKRW